MSNSENPQDRTLTDPPKNFSNGMSWEMDEYGNHRLVSNTEKGCWKYYRDPAVLNNYMCFSGYWEGIVPTEQLLEFKIVK